MPEEDPELFADASRGSAFEEPPDVKGGEELGVRHRRGKVKRAREEVVPEHVWKRFTP